MKLTLLVAATAMLGFSALLARSSVAGAAVPASIDAECDLRDVLALESIDGRLHERLRRLALR